MYRKESYERKVLNYKIFHILHCIIVRCVEGWFSPTLCTSSYGEIKWATFRWLKKKQKNFRFADDIVVNAEQKETAGVLVDRLDKTATRYKMEIGPDKTIVMTNNSNGFQREIKIKGQRLEEVENFKYLGAIISNEGSKPEFLSRIAQTTAALSRLKIIWRDKNISFAS